MIYTVHSEQNSVAESITCCTCMSNTILMNGCFYEIKIKFAERTNIMAEKMQWRTSRFSLMCVGDKLATSTASPRCSSHRTIT